LAIQPKDTTLWYLPGGLVQAGETAEQALERLLLAQTGIAPRIGHLAYVWQYRHKTTERLELFFVIGNTSAYREPHQKTRLSDSKELDDIGYLQPTGNRELRPAFLQRESIAQASSEKGAPVKFVSN
jgi:8-oxo-dGTP pyrophosphatase MutT (NUDIX family)